MDIGKRLVALVLTFCMSVSLCSCAGKTQETTESFETNEEDFRESRPHYCHFSKLGKYRLELGSLLGFDDCYCLGEISSYDYCIWNIYNGDHEMIASSFGFGYDRGPEYYLFDIDSDGQKDIICNCIYDADGACRVFIFRNNNGTVEIGTLDEEKIADGLGVEMYVLAYNVYYYDDKKVIIFDYMADDIQLMLDSDDFIFKPFDPDHSF